MREAGQRETVGVSPRKEAPIAIENRIFNLRGQPAMLDVDLAALYGVETRAILQAIRRNKERFPDDFPFPLSGQEVARLRSQL